MKLTFVQILLVLACVIGLSSQTAQNKNTEGGILTNCCPNTSKKNLTPKEREAEMDRKLSKLDSIASLKPNQKNVRKRKQ